MVLVLVWYGMVRYWYWYGIGMHIISNAYHFHVMVCNGMVLVLVWYGMVLVLVLAYYCDENPHPLSVVCVTSQSGMILLHELDQLVGFI
jgi:hypothetical protein